MFLGPGVTIIDAKKLEDALWDHLVSIVVKNIARIKVEFNHFALDGAIQHFNQKPKIRPELKKRVIERLGENPFLNDSVAEVASKLKEDKELGDYFAGEERKLPGRNDIEYNTDEERKIIQQIRYHIDSNFSINPSIANYIKWFLKFDEYSDIFVEPKQEFVYRGISVDRETSEEVKKKIELGNGNFLFNPIKEVSSWSKSKMIAHGFGKPLSDKNVGLLMRASVHDNQGKFFDLKMWYKQISSNNEEEEEVIGLGEIFVNSVEFI
jgi:hypothetical protein